MKTQVALKTYLVITVVVMILMQVYVVYRGVESEGRNRRGITKAGSLDGLPDELNFDHQIPDIHKAQKLPRNGGIPEEGGGKGAMREGSSQDELHRTLKALVQAGYHTPSQYQQQLAANPADSLTPPLFSKINCSHPESVCLFENLYYVDRSFHLFLPGASSTEPLQIHLSPNSEHLTLIHVHDYAPPLPYKSIPRFDRVSGIFTCTDKSLFELLFLGTSFWLGVLGNRLFNEKEFVFFLRKSVQLDASTLEALLPAYNVHNLDAFGDIIFEKAIVGIPDDFTYSALAAVPQGVLEKSSLKARALKQFTALIREDLVESLMKDQQAQTQKNPSTPKSSLTINLGDSARPAAIDPLTRRQVIFFGDQRAKIENVDALVAEYLKGTSLPKPRVLQVGSPLNVYEETFIDLQFDVHIRAYNPAMAGLMLMRPDTTLIEVLPPGVSIPAHLSCLAATLGVQHFVFDRNGPRAAGAISRKPPLSKPAVTVASSWGRNTAELSLSVDPPAMVRVLSFATNGKHKKYLSIMPWEQLNNQLIEFKAGCATAIFLNRTLVLPHLGWRKTEVWDFNFVHQDFEWNPFEYYYDPKDLHKLPCDYLTMEEYAEFYLDSPPTMVFNPVAKATNTQQLEDYYCTILGFPCKGAMKTIPRQQQVNRTTIETLLDFDDPALFMGAMFWFYDFGRYQPYPLVEYVNYMDDPIYNRIVASLSFSRKIQGFLEAVFSKIGQKFNSIHVRRGDYYNKCVKIKDRNLQQRCFPPAEVIEKRMLAAFDPALPVYISTNVASDKSEFAVIESKFRVVYINDLLDNLQELDKNELALFDQGLCRRSTKFIGNFYSSFSRSIAEFREADGHDFEFW